MITSVRALAERNMAAAAKAQQIHDALTRGDNNACELFDQLRAENPELARAVAAVLSRTGGAR